MSELNSAFSQPQCTLVLSVFLSLAGSDTRSFWTKKKKKLQAQEQSTEKMGFSCPRSYTPFFFKNRYHYFLLYMNRILSAFFPSRITKRWRKTPFVLGKLHVCFYMKLKMARELNHFILLISLSWERKRVPLSSPPRVARVASANAEKSWGQCLGRVECREDVASLLGDTLGFSPNLNHRAMEKFVNTGGHFLPLFSPTLLFLKGRW